MKRARTKEHGYSVNKTISMPESLWKPLQEFLSEQEELILSVYLRGLIRADLAKRNVLAKR